MLTKTNAIPYDDLWPLIKSIKPFKLKIYSALLYWLACRAGELLPYQHYKVTYKRDEKDVLIRDKKGHCFIDTKEEVYSTKGVRVSTIKVLDNLIEFGEIPVFKSKNKNSVKIGFVPRKDNPLFDDILSYVNNRKELQVTENIRAENSGTPPATIYLFEREEQDSDDLHFFWRFKKRLDRIMAKKGFTSHSFRKTRLTVAANSSGDAYYVKSISGHASIEMASEYVAPKRLLDNMKKYEGI